MNISTELERTLILYQWNIMNVIFKTNAWYTITVDRILIFPFRLILHKLQLKSI